MHYRGLIQIAVGLAMILIARGAIRVRVNDPEHFAQWYEAYGRYLNIGGMTFAFIGLLQLFGLIGTLQYQGLAQIAGGMVIVLFADGRIDINPKDREKFSDWMEAYSGYVRLGGLFFVILGTLQLVHIFK